MKLAILDYGSGNIFSLKTSFERCDIIIDVITSLDEINNHSGLLLPGVGSFDPAMININKCSSNSLELITHGKIPILGICLGMEIFFESSQEGSQMGLGVMNGKVILLPKEGKIPHMGWNNLIIKKSGRLLEGVENNSYVYFTHSYTAHADDSSQIMAVAKYNNEIPAVVEKDNFFGTQFHPEKSSKNGMQMIENFIKVCKQ